MRDTGICFEYGAACCVKHEVPVQMAFRVEDKFNGKVRFVTVAVTNHTECGCN